MRDPNSFSFKPFFIALFVGIVLVTAFFLFRDSFGGANINSFDDCVKADNPVMESYPEQCAAGDRTFVNTEQLTQ